MNQLKTGALLSYIIIGVNMVVGLLYTPYMLRMLGQSEYGLYSLAASVIAYLTVLDLGFANAIIRYTAKFRAEGKVEEQYELFGMFFRLYLGIGVVALLIGVVMLFSIDSLFATTMTRGELSTMKVLMLLMAFNLAFTFPLSIFGAIISAYENFVFQKVVNLVRVFLNPLIMVILLSFGYKAIAMVVITTIFNIVTLSVNCWYCYNKLHIKLYFRKFNILLLKEVSLYSVWIFLNVIMDRIYWSTGQFVLGIFRGTDAVAIYALAIQLKQMFYMFSTSISGVFLPKITAMVAKGVAHKKVSDLFIRTGRIQFIVMSFILSGFILLGRPFIHLWAGVVYDNSYVIALLLFIPTLVPLIQNLGIVILQARNQMKFRSLLILSISVLSLFISLPLAKYYGGIGCAIATSFAVLIGHGIILNIYYKKKIGLDIKSFWFEILKMSITPLIIILCGIFALKYIAINSVIQLMLAGVVFFMIYVPFFWMFSMNSYERDLFQYPVRKIFSRLCVTKQSNLNT